MDKQDFILFFVIPFLFITCGWCLCDLYHIRNVAGISFSTVSNQTLDEDVKDIYADVDSFYKYNISNVDNELTDEQLKQQGGVCWHYAEYYEKKLRALGYNTGTLVMQTSKGEGHMIAWVSAPHEYCILDQRIIRCTDIK